MIKYPIVSPFLHYNTSFIEYSTVEKFTLVQFFHFLLHLVVFSIVYYPNCSFLKIGSLSFYAYSLPLYSLVHCFTKTHPCLFLYVCLSDVNFSLHIPDFLIFLLLGLMSLSLFSLALFSISPPIFFREFSPGISIW